MELISSYTSYKKIIIVGCVITAIIAVMIIFVPSLIFIPKYRVDVETVQSGLTIKFIKVKITNTGSERLTNVVVHFGLDDEQNIGTLEPRKSVWLSPNNKLPPFVQITSDEGILVMKNLDTNIPYVKTDAP